jgi:hypothetical protein
MANEKRKKERKYEMVKDIEKLVLFNYSLHLNLSVIQFNLILLQLLKFPWVFCFGFECCRLNIAPFQNSYVEALTPG